ncbi:hypothetical protein FH972_025781 [Carpinus fangiana]|uniref:Histone deacetylase interacting domain-containing protein n=1 Tax=Carpinus fangiana TaxID=176857 RepID=A0A5N6L237_9ROSI|nr:hypothetical protein FH972_025781 [Carpinus fangiana]
MALFGPAPGTAPGGPAVAPGQQPILNDALSYLDQVKVQFSGEPNVYNQFLDIMKDFKSQAIDTPGVIGRVSQLFQGNPPLIQGFNTFLPPGYLIECGTADDPNAIRVTTPMGTTVSPMGSELPPANPRPINGDRHYDNNEHPGWQQMRPGEEGGHAVFSPASRAQMLPAYPGPQGQERLSPGAGQANTALLAHRQEQRGMNALGNAVSAATGEPIARQPGQSPLVDANLPMSAQQQGMEKRGPVEFNHAIDYVNKIKTRFAAQPEIYKQFLEILQTYQRESKHIQEVYKQVTHLFNGAPDLLQDFKQFLPDTPAAAKQQGAAQRAEEATRLSDVRGGYGDGMQHTPRPEHRLPPVGNFAPTPSANRDGKRKRGDRQGMVGAMDYGAQGSSKHGYPSNKRNKQAGHLQHASKPHVPADAPEVTPALVPGLPEPMPPSTTTTASSEELAFFDRVKKFFGNKNTMNEFLKLCNLFSQDLIDKNLLVFRAQNFIGTNPELFNWFKNFLQYDGRDQIIENRARASSGRVNLNNCRSLGQSYRQMPKRERNKPCSGRDEMCNSVLNDEWVSHPTWASEDSGFIAHRKNNHEEGLHRIEEERHDYDLNIANVERTIQLMEPLAQQNLMMSEEDRKLWTLPRDFAGQSQAIYKKVLAKLYGRDYAKQIMSDTSSSPSNVVPVILQRCRVILETWKASQREWEKVWREQTQRMFWKSLDHQGANVKGQDKRQFQAKTLQNEVQIKFEEQKKARASGFKLVPRMQMVTKVDDKDVIIDAARLLLLYAEQQHQAEFPRLTPFVMEFIPLMFGVDLADFNKRVSADLDINTADEDVEEEAATSEDSGTPRSRRGRKGDLLRGVLDKTKGARPRGDREASANNSDSGAASPDVASVADDVMMTDPTEEEPEEEPKTWIKHLLTGNKAAAKDIQPNQPYKRSQFNLYATSQIFCFFRMFLILYERLYSLKNNEALVHDTVRRANAPKAAIDLKMMDKLPSDFFQDTSPTANYYKQMLQMLENFVTGEGNVDMPFIEEVLRRYYLQSGWMLYTFDKLMGALVRFAIQVLGGGPDANQKSWEITQLFCKDRKKDISTHEEELQYRKTSEKLNKEGDVYKITWHAPTSTANIRLFKRDENTFELSGEDDGLKTREERWQHYVASFQTLDPTEHVLYSELKPTYAKRNLKAALETAGKSIDAASSNANGSGDDVEAKTVAREHARLDQVNALEQLRIRIAIDDYHMVWGSRNEDGTPKDGEHTEFWLADEDHMAVPGRKKRPSTTSRQPSGDVGKAAANAESLDKDAEAASTDAEAKEGVATEEEQKDEPAKKDTDVAGEEAMEEEDTGNGHNESDDLHFSKSSTFEEKFVMNNSWMRGLTKDEVDEANRGLVSWKESAEATV